MGRYAGSNLPRHLHDRAANGADDFVHPHFLVIAFGLGLHSRVWIVFLFAFVIIAINTTAGVRNVDPTLTEMAKSFRRQRKRACS
jgi:hypothetical protein